MSDAARDRYVRTGYGDVYRGVDAHSQTIGNILRPSVPPKRNPGLGRDRTHLWDRGRTNPRIALWYRIGWSAASLAGTIGAIVITHGR